MTHSFGAVVIHIVNRFACAQLQGYNTSEMSVVSTTHMKLSDALDMPRVSIKCEVIFHDMTSFTLLHEQRMCALRCVCYAIQSVQLHIWSSIRSFLCICMSVTILTLESISFITCWSIFSIYLFSCVW